MKIKFFLVISVFIAAVSASGVHAQNRQKAAVRQIETYARSIERVTARRKEPDMVFADIAADEEEKAKWRKFASIKELEKFRDKTETYSIAYNWKLNGSVVAANFTIFSPSGDWAKYVMHYFRADGSLAKVTSELRTFYGDFIAKRTEYFDAAGRTLKKGTTYRDLMTNKPKKPSKDMLADNPSVDGTDHYKRVRDLPYAKLGSVK